MPGIDQQVKPRPAHRNRISHAILYYGAFDVEASRCQSYFPAALTARQVAVACAYVDYRREAPVVA